MTFTLKQTLGTQAPLVHFECPTGKAPFPTRTAAHAAPRAHQLHATRQDARVSLRLL